jgi:hypothetical protein
MSDDGCGHRAGLIAIGPDQAILSFAARVVGERQTP